MTDPFIEGLADGLRPRDPDEIAADAELVEMLAAAAQPDTIAISDLALIGLDAKLARIEKLHERAADAAERQADALKTLVALFASTIGTAHAWCPGEDSPIVNYVRSGDGKPFRCDQDQDVSDDDA